MLLGSARGFLFVVLKTGLHFLEQTSQKSSRTKKLFAQPQQSMRASSFLCYHSETGFVYEHHDTKCVTRHILALHNVTMKALGSFFQVCACFKEPEIKTCS